MRYFAVGFFACFMTILAAMDITEWYAGKPADGITIFWATYGRAACVLVLVYWAIIRTNPRG